MSHLESFYLLFLFIQFCHSIEELSTGFHNKCPLFKLKFKTFLLFEIFFIGFWIAVYFLHEIPFRNELMAIFNVLMFANGIWHLTWFGIEKRYVPGIVTAPFFIVLFLIFYIKIFFGVI